MSNRSNSAGGPKAPLMRPEPQAQRSGAGSRDEAINGRRHPAHERHRHRLREQGKEPGAKYPNSSSSHRRAQTWLGGWGAVAPRRQHNHNEPGRGHDIKRRAIRIFSPGENSPPGMLDERRKTNPSKNQEKRKKKGFDSGGEVSLPFGGREGQKWIKGASTHTEERRKEADQFRQYPPGAGR